MTSTKRPCVHAAAALAARSPRRAVREPASHIRHLSSRRCTRAYLTGHRTRPGLRRGTNVHQPNTCQRSCQSCMPDSPSSRTPIGIGPTLVCVRAAHVPSVARLCSARGNHQRRAAKVRRQRRRRKSSAAIVVGRPVESTGASCRHPRRINQLPKAARAAASAASGAPTLPHLSAPPPTVRSPRRRRANSTRSTACAHL